MSEPAELLPEDYLPDLARVTGMSEAEWADFLACTPEQQAAIAQGYRDQDWTRNASAFDRVLAILGLIGTVAGVASGVAGAATAIAALRAL